MQRHYGLDLLRIIAMAMILLLHFNGAALGLPAHTAQWSTPDIIKTAIECVCIVGVNIFVLISGYFGIRLTRNKLLNYTLICITYSAILGLWAFLTYPAKYTSSVIVDSLLVFSRTDLWFVRDYLFLMALSPLINAGLDALTRRTLAMTTVSVLVICCYFGWLHGYTGNSHGYTLIQLISIYIVGYALRQCTIPTPIAAIGYALGTLAIFVMALYVPSRQVYAYNSPAVITASVSLFVLFSKLRISNIRVQKGIICIASASFAVYLIHKNQYAWVHIFLDNIRHLNKTYDGIAFGTLIVAFYLGTYATCIVIEHLRQRITAQIFGMAGNFSNYFVKIFGKYKK